MTAPLPPEVVEGWRKAVIAAILENVTCERMSQWASEDELRGTDRAADAILSALPLERVVEALRPLANECDAVTKWNGDDPPTYSQILPPDNDWAPCFRTKYGDIRRAREALSLALGGRGGSKGNQEDMSSVASRGGTAQAPKSDSSEGH